SKWRSSRHQVDVVTRPSVNSTVNVSPGRAGQYSSILAPISSRNAPGYPSGLTRLQESTTPEKNDMMTVPPLRANSWMADTPGSSIRYALGTIRTLYEERSLEVETTSTGMCSCQSGV